MGTKIFIVITAVIYILFLLSALGPMKSQKKFWLRIYKIRRGMDFCVYWFFNLCAIASIVCAILVLTGFLTRF